MDNGRAMRERGAATRDRTRDLQIFSLTLSQLSYRGATTPTHPFVQEFTHTHAVHLESHARVHLPPASSWVLAGRIDP